MMRDCTDDEKDKLFEFLIGYYLSTSGNVGIFITPETIEQSAFKGHTPLYSQAHDAYILRLQ